MTASPTQAAPAALPQAEWLGPSLEDLAELERELDLYVAFWAHARDRRSAALEETQ